ncbi:gamma-glutamyl-gamma-aminobutyrate hydrolase family protein [Photobacterium sp. CCB-ST2H9]|uniref:gamma-glutamyl-gamma-aminobutyrate hydrolase family protein n=1 Tax=Photobacterium sp. CCB-ST2H9 TaxID=2912855 RepID=UPI002005ED71|nr:gamma-glutamyl-gamma-aminobutyrate hydrolase family protein [Photobacterium sp. CCB-ST2H9]UTM60204.1 gamma-glutamyl-gamma-aminobutyrate hydrolase family protein [Photobacterium sp. CCB-ST2H9]
MNSTQTGPVIGVVCCKKSLEGYGIQSVNEFYLNAVKLFGANPVLFPAGSSAAEIRQLISLVDGVLLTGSHSNVAPGRYGAEHDEPKKDEGRDALSFSLIDTCIQQEVPILGICRGFQEMNVALGGTLHPKVHEVAGFQDHRESPLNDMAMKYAPAHPVNISDNGTFAEWLAPLDNIQVNSLHGQGVRQLAPGLTVEAVSPDGLIEAFSLKAHPFFIGVQWHPEWQATENHFSRILFDQFMISASQRRSLKDGIRTHW